MDILQHITHPIEKDFELFKARYLSLFSTDNVFLNRVLAHVAGHRGKMLRPILVLLSAKSLGEINDATHYAASVVELLHNASLVHDDVVDDSALRHGSPSVHAAFCNKVAVLTGDYLLSSALFHASSTGNLQIVEAISQLGRDLAKGEILQLSDEYRASLSEELYYRVIRLKTASLFATCAKIGALSVGASAELAEKMYRFGEILGIGFQIRDDIFDYFKDEKQIGKPTGNDMLEGKLTLPAIYAFTHHHDDVANGLIAKMKEVTLSAEEIAYLIEFVKSHGGIDYARSSMACLRDEALTMLPSEIAPEVRSSLVALVDYMIERDF